MGFLCTKSWDAAFPTFAPVAQGLLTIRQFWWSARAKKGNSADGFLQPRAALHNLSIVTYIVLAYKQSPTPSQLQLEKRKTQSELLDFQPLILHILKDKDVKIGQTSSAWHRRGVYVDNLLELASRCFICYAQMFQTSWRRHTIVQDDSAQSTIVLSYPLFS
jgi:hypothetical protein